MKKSKKTLKRISYSLGFIFIMFIYIMNSSGQVPDNRFKQLNFESGGYVTEVIPAYNPTGNIYAQILYAKTDIGGVYRSDNNGQSWKQIATYARTDANSPTISYSEYIIAGLAVKPDNPNTVLAGWGNNIEDAQVPSNNGYPFQSIWRSTDGGNTWPNRSGFANIGTPGVWFQGDRFERKIGGDPILFYPQSGMSNYVLMGGISPYSNAQPNLFWSADAGNNFSALPNTIFSTTNNDTIICIAMDKDRSQTWVGTTYGLYVSTGFDANNQPLPFSLVQQYPNVRKILLKPDPINLNDVYAIVAYGAAWNGWPYGNLARYVSGSWDNSTITNQFNSQAGSDYYTDQNYFSMLTWVDDAQTILLAGRWDKPILKSYDYGSSWSGETNGWFDNVIELVYDHTNPNNSFPNHQFQSELSSFIYTGVSSLTRNPYVSSGNYWYVSGGAGLRQSDGSIPPTGIIFDNAPSYAKLWQYSTLNQAMTVAYDISFGQNYTLMPIADWTLAWTTNAGNWTSKLNYDNQITPGNQQTWIGNVSRSLISLNNPNVAYCVGGDVYSMFSGSHRAAMYVRTQGSTSVTHQTSDPIFNQDDRFICDGIIYGNDQLTVLIGSEQKINAGIYPYSGIYNSNDGGVSFTQGTFDQPSMAPGLNTQTQYLNSKLPSLGYSGKIGGEFDAQFNLVNASGTNYIYLYLESGGMFISNNLGSSWASVNNPYSTGYFDEGCLRFDQTSQDLYLAIKDHGLFKATINSNGTLNWSTISGFNGATEVDVSGNLWAVFGKKSGDNFYKLYQSTDGSNSFSLITGDIRGIRSLRISPNQTNELWIATTGYGVLIDNDFGVCSTTVNNNFTWTQNTIDCDIVVGSSGNLTISNLNISVSSGVSIIVNGGILNINNTTFQTTTSGSTWNGIVLNDAAGFNITSSTINSAVTPITFNNSSTNLVLSNINNNVFNLDINSLVAISGTNLEYIYCQGNIFNLSGTFGGNPSAVGINVINSLYSTSQKLGIFGNTFNGGGVQVSLVDLTNVLYVSMDNNTYSGDNNTICLWVNNVSGPVRNSTFTNSNYNNPIQILQSDFDFYHNTINANNGSDFVVDLNSNANMTSTGSAITGGYNSISINNNTSSIMNILFTSGSTVFVDGGHNCFNINPLPPCSTCYYISGSFPITSGCPIPYPASSNYWNIITPSQSNYNITCGGNSIPVNYIPTDQIQLCLTPPGGSNYLLADNGFGAYDTIYLLSTGVGGGESSRIDQVTDKSLYFSMWNKCRIKDYAGAIIDAKNLISNFDSSKYLLPALDKLFSYYQRSDTTNNQNNRITLYGDLKSFIEQKMLQGQNNQNFVKKAYHYYLICLVRLRSFQEAIGGYENIMNNSSDTLARLMASWDRSNVVLLMNQGGGGGEPGDENIIDNTSNPDKLLNNKPAHEIARQTFINEKITAAKELTNSKFSGNKKIYSKVESSITKFNPKNRNDLIKKIQQDQKILLGLDKKGNENNFIPKTFALAQNYPNPFNPVTTIKYDLPKDINVTIKIYDILGRLVTTLINNEYKKAGSYVIKWNGSNFASGVYFYRLEAGNFVSVKKMVLLK